MKKILFFLLLTISTAVTYGQELAVGEYYFDTPVAPGAGTPFTFSEADAIDMDVLVPASVLTMGKHTMFIRVKDINGIWSFPEARTFYIVPYIPVEATPKLSEAEWYVDADPGVGNGTAVDFEDADDIDTLVNAASTGLATGSHKIFIRVRDLNGTWSHPMARDFTLCEPVASPVVSDQQVCAGTGVGELVADGTDIKWYADETAETPLDAGDFVLTGTYYVTQTIVCESDRVPVEVELTPCILTACGVTLEDINSTIQAQIIPDATHYRFRVTDGMNTEILEKEYSYFDFTELSFTQYNVFYTIDVAAMVDGNWGNYGQECSVVTPQLLPKIEDVYCDTEVSATTAILADAIFGATQYRFRVNDGATTVIIDKPIGTLHLASVEGFTYGVSYTIDVAVEVGGAFTDFGTTCTVHLGDASTNILDTLCNTTVETGTILYANLVPGATHYRFRVSDGVNVMTIDRITRTLKFDMLPQYVYGTSYTIDVAVEIGGIYTDYGSACTVNLAAVSTNILESLCDTTVAPATILYANPVIGATHYRFRITAGANVMTLDRASRTMKLDMLPEYVYGTSYTIDVAVEVNGSYGSYGPACTIHLAGASTNIIDSLCDTTVTPTTILYANPVVGATHYRFRLTAGANVMTIDRTSRTLKLEMLPYMYGTSYTVDVAVEVNGAYAAYGPACTVHLDAPSTNVISAICDTQITPGTIIYANPVPGATQYRFRIIAGANVMTIDRPTRTMKFDMLPWYEYSTTYTIDVAIEVGGNFTPYGQACNVHLPHATTNLLNTICDTQVSPATILSANLVPGATQYRFRVTSGANVMTIDRPTRTMKLNMMPEYIYGTTYTVDVAVEAGGNFGPYGSACNVHLIAPTTKIADAMCGSDVTANTTLYANLVPGATQYRFRVTNGATTTTLDRNTRAMRLDMLAEPLSGALYAIDVAVMINGNWGDYGPSCDVWIVGVTSGLIDELCGGTLFSTGVLIAKPVSGAEVYLFEFWGEFGYTTEGTANNELPISLYEFEGQALNVIVHVFYNGSWYNGELCTVTITAPDARYAIDSTEIENNATDVVAYPNPFDTEFSLNILAGTTESVHITVHDIAGKQLEDITVYPSELRSLTIGESYSAGLYNVVVTQGSYQKALKMVKK